MSGRDKPWLLIPATWPFDARWYASEGEALIVAKGRAVDGQSSWVYELQHFVGRSSPPHPRLGNIVPPGWHFFAPELHASHSGLCRECAIEERKRRKGKEGER